MKNYFIEMFVDYGRLGVVSGRFVLNENEWSKLQEEIGKCTVVYFGEILGKHSDVYFELEEDMFKILTDDQDFLNMAKNLNISLDSGYNPLHYINDSEDLGLQ